MCARSEVRGALRKLYQAAFFVVVGLWSCWFVVCGMWLCGRVLLWQGTSPFNLPCGVSFEPASPVGSGGFTPPSQMGTVLRSYRPEAGDQRWRVRRASLREGPCIIFFKYFQALRGARRFKVWLYLIFQTISFFFSNDSHFNINEP